MFKEQEPTLRARTEAITTRWPWRVLLLALALTVAISMMAFAGEGVQAKKKKSRSFSQQDTAVQADYNRRPANGAPINNIFDPFRFSKTSKMTSLNRVALAQTVRPDPNMNFDANELFLALDGINTGISARVYTTDPNGNVVLLFNGVPANAPRILNALQRDGRLQASLIDVGGNELTSNGRFTTVLVIKGKLQKRR